MYLERVRRLESEMERVSSGLALVSQVCVCVRVIIIQAMGRLSSTNIVSVIQYAGKTLHSLNSRGIIGAFTIFLGKYSPSGPA